MLKMMENENYNDKGELIDRAAWFTKINNIYKVCYRFTVFQIILAKSSKVEVFTQPISLLQSSDFIHFSSHRSMLHVSDENLTFRKIISLSLFF